MDAKMVAAGTMLLFCSSAILFLSGIVTSVVPVVVLSLSPLFVAALAYLFNSLGIGSGVSSR
jgi:drug/metabolite transporter (DMT)-like permease